MLRFSRSRKVILTSQVVAGVMLAGSATFAAGIGDLTAQATKTRGHLSIRFQDVEDQPQRCPLHVNRMEYLASLSALVVDLTAETCALDVTGKREGTLHWDLPYMLRSQGKLKLIVQGKSLGGLQWEGDQAQWIQEAPGGRRKP